MSSRARQKAAAREARLAAEAAARRQARRRRALLRLAIIASLAALVVTAAALAGPGEEEPATTAPPSRLFDGISQDGISLGSPNAPAVLTEFADLQCPYCAAYARDVLPTVVDRYVSLLAAAAVARHLAGEALSARDVREITDEAHAAERQTGPDVA